jgi:AcrR family transcriptional regulator
MPETDWSVCNAKGNKMNKGSDTRHRILSAAINIFSQKGYHNTKVDDIVAAAKTSKGGVYFHFPSKQDIFLGLVDAFAEMLESRIQKSMQAQGSNIQRVDAALQACIDTFLEYRKLSKIFLVQAAGLGNVYEEKQRKIHERFVKIIKIHLDMAIDNGEIQPMNTLIAALAWMGAINEVVIRWIQTGEPDLEKALPDLRAFLLRSLGLSAHQIERTQI